MKLCAFIVIVIALMIGADGYSVEDYAVGIQLDDPDADADDEPTCTKSGPQCTADCSTVMLCSAFSPVPIQKTSCYSPTQYCVNGACSASPGTKCKVTGPTFTCTDVGIFPEPSDCTQYHVCDDDGKHDVYQCFDGWVFNSQLSMCQIGKTPCNKIDCSKATEANPFVVYPGNPAYYAFCMKHENGAIQTLMFKCPYEKFEVFDVKIKACKFNCKAKGNFQNPADCSEYYYCSGVNALPVLSECASNWVFDGSGCNKDVKKCQYPPLELMKESEEELVEDSSEDS